MKQWMIPLLLALAGVSHAEHQIDFDPNLFTGSAAPAHVYANIGFPTGVDYEADLSGPSGFPLMYHAVWTRDDEILNAAPINSITIDYGCSTETLTLNPFTVFYIPGPANPPSGPTSFPTMHCDAVNLPPMGFDLLSPANGSVDQASPVTLSWQASSDFEMEDLTYTVYVATSPDGLDGFPVSSGIDLLSYSFSGDPGVTYYWTVSVEDTADHLVWADSTFSFTFFDPGTPPLLNPVNDQSTFEETPLQIYVSASDNEDGDFLDFEASSSDPRVSLQIEEPVEYQDCNLTLIPGLDFYGEVTITLSVTDSDGNTDQGSFLLTVNNVNDPPSAFSLLLPEDEAVLNVTTAQLLWQSGSDPDPVDDFYYSVFLSTDENTVWDVENEVASWISDTTLYHEILSPGPWYWGVRTYDSSESETDSPVWSFTRNLPPVLDAVDDQVFDEDTGVDLEVSATDPDSPTLEFQFASSDPNLVVELVPARDSRLISLTPAADWYGEADVTVTVTDLTDLEDSISFHVTVSPTADAPQAFDLLAPADEATMVAFPATLSWEESVDPDLEDTVTYTVYVAEDPESVTTSPVEGGLFDTSVTVGGTPGATYWWTVKADDGNSAPVWATSVFSFTYDLENQPPILNPIGARQTNEDTQTSFVVTGYDPEEAGLTFDVSSDTSGVVAEWLTLRESQWLTLSPVANWNGTAHITVTLTDPELLETSETFTLTVLPVNDPPTVSEFNMYTPEDTPATIPWEGEDVDGDELTYETFGAAHGIVEGNTYIPFPDWNGFDAFAYRAFDGTVWSFWTAIQVNIEPINDAPLLDLPASLAMAEDDSLVLDFTDFMSDVDMDSLVISVATPTDLIVNITGYDVVVGAPANWSGEETLTFTIDDRALRLVASDTLHVSVSAVNDAPTAGSLSLDTDEDTALDVTLPIADVEGSPLTVTIDTAPLHGLFAGSTYTPAPDFFGSDSMSYHANDGELDSETAWIFFTVNPVNDAPLADSQVLETPEETTLAITFSGSDVDGDELTFVTVDMPQHGSFLGGNYTPVLDFFGLDSLSFRADDGLAQSDLAWVVITVLNQNDCPVLVTPFEDVSMPEPDEDMVYTITGAELISHYIDPDGDVINADDVSVNVPANFNGSLTVNYEVTSGDCSDQGSFDLLVTAVNDAPEYSLCGIDCGEIEDLEAFATAFASAGITLNDIDGDSLSVVWFVNDEMVCTQAFDSTADCAAFCLDLTPWIEDPQDITVYFEVHDDSTVVNAQGVDCSWFLGFLDLADAALPDRFYLSPNHPNPFNPSTTISFGLPREMRLRAEVFNLRGQRVAVLHDGPMPAGNHQMIWNAGDSASGMYVLVLSSEEGVKRQKMMLVR